MKPRPRKRRRARGSSRTNRLVRDLTGLLIALGFALLTLKVLLS